MSSDMYGEMEEDAHKEAEKKRLAIQAAIDLLRNGKSMDTAISDTQNRFYEQSEAITEGKVFDAPSGGNHEFHNQALNDLDIPKGKERQIKAIAKKIMGEID